MSSSHEHSRKRRGEERQEQRHSSRQEHETHNHKHHSKSDHPRKASERSTSRENSSRDVARHRSEGVKIKTERDVVIKQEHSDDDSAYTAHRRSERKRSAERRHKRETERRSRSPVGRDQGEDNTREQRMDRFQNDRRRLDKRAQRMKQESDQDFNWGKSEEGTAQPEVKKDKEKPSMELSGKLAEDTNVFRGVVIKYNEPPEARKPKKRWRFHPFKGDEALAVLHLHRQSAFLLGRDRKVADIPVDHPSCSKQHAVFQFRLVDFKRQDGSMGRRVSPYIIDLGSANGTFVNNQRIDSERYVELFEKDVIKFGFSSRDYVLLHDSSDTSELAEDLGD